MAKTLSESAAEILNASIGMNQDPATLIAAEIVDLGGATHDDPAGTITLQTAKKAVLPNSKKDDAEEMNSVKSAGLAAPAAVDSTLNPDLGEETEVNSEEEIIAEIVEEEAEQTDKEVELSEEDDVIDRVAMVKEMIAKHKGTMAEDVDALFNGESLSEEFRVKATLIFESAVSSRVEKIVEGVLDDNDVLLAETIETIKSELSEQVDSYLNYVVEEWVKDNSVGIDSGLRAELTEDFINGLKNLFAEHYIEIPDEKVDIAEELASKVIDLEEAIETTSAELSAQVKALTEELNSVKKDKAIRLACEGLTEVQAGKMKSLTASVEFTTAGEFDHKLAVIRENYFPNKSTVTSEVKVLQETSVSEENPAEVEKLNNIMTQYVNAIKKTVI